MVRIRIDKVVKKTPATMAKKRKSAALARAALAAKRERESAEWQPPPLPPGFPERPANIVDYVCDFISTTTGLAWGNYAKMATSLGVSRQVVHEWKKWDHIPEKYLPSIIMHTGINAATLIVWNGLHVGKPRK